MSATPLVAAGLVVLTTAVARTANARSRTRRRLPILSFASSPTTGPAVRARLETVFDRVKRVAASPADDDLEHATLLESVAAARRSGGSLLQAIDEAVAALVPARSAIDLTEVVHITQAGGSLTEALTDWGARGGEARALAGAALALGAELGGASARSLDAAAAGLRDRAELGREVRALTSQARASAAVMVLAPVGFVVLAGSADPRIVSSLLTTPAGLACLAGGAALDAVGALWMRRLTRFAA